jgi:hypothetical protein
MVGFESTAEFPAECALKMTMPEMMLQNCGESGAVRTGCFPGTEQEEEDLEELAES